MREMTNEEKIEKIYEAIDVLLSISAIEEVDAHEVSNSENSWVSKLRSCIF